MKSKKNIFRLFRRIDIFGQSVGFTLDDGEKYKTSPGALLSLIAMIIVLIQFYQKMNVLVFKRDTNYMTTIELGDNSAEEAIGFEETGINFAFGILPDNFYASGRKIDDIAGYLEVNVV